MKMVDLCEQAIHLNTNNPEQSVLVQIMYTYLTLRKKSQDKNHFPICKSSPSPWCTPVIPRQRTRSATTYAERRKTAVTTASEYFVHISAKRTSVVKNQIHVL